MLKHEAVALAVSVAAEAGIPIECYPNEVYGSILVEVLGWNPYSEVPQMSPGKLYYRGSKLSKLMLAAGLGARVGKIRKGSFEVYGAYAP
jgi:hypothetical protein